MTIQSNYSKNPYEDFSQTGLKGTGGLKPDPTLLDQTPKITPTQPTLGGADRLITTTLPTTTSVTSDFEAAKATKGLEPMERPKEYAQFLDPDKIAAFDGIWAAMRQAVASGNQTA